MKVPSFSRDSRESWESPESMLRRWGAWSREANSLRIKPLMMFDDGKREASPPMMNDDEAARFDPAVCMLKQVFKEQYDVIRLHYVYGMSYRAIAKIQGVDSRRISERGELGAAFVYGYVFGAEAGLMPEKSRDSL